VRVEDRRVPMTEGATHRILPAQPDRNAVEEQAAIREQLGGAPVDSLATRHACRALLEELGYPLVRRESRRPARDPGWDLSQSSRIDARLGTAILTGGTEPIPQTAERRHTRPHAVAPCRVERLVERRPARAAHRGRGVALDDARVEEPLPVALGDRGVRSNALVHHGMRDRRVIQLVVAVAAIADEV